MEFSELVRPLIEPVDWASLRFPGETVLRLQVDRTPELINEAIRWCDPETCPTPVPRGLKYSGMRAAAVSSAFASISAFLKDLLQLNSVPEFTVFPSEEWFAEILPAIPGAPLRIGVSSASCQNVGVREALFFLGRRLARTIYNQYAFLSNPTAGVRNSDRNTLLLRGLWKFQELTCDRVGLLCCQNADVACRVLVKSMTGLDSELLTADWEELIANRVEEEDALVGDDIHDFTVLRIAALRRFATSEKYSKCFADESLDMRPPLSFVEVVEWPENIPQAKAMEPPPGETVLVTVDSKPEPVPEPVPVLTSESPTINAETTVEESDITRQLREFALWGALWVVGAKPTLDEETRSALWEMFGSEATAALDELLVGNGDECCARHCVRAAKRAAMAPLEARVGVIEDFMNLSLADARISSRERDRIVDLAELLDLTQQQVADIASEFVDPDFAKYRFVADQEVEVKLDDEWLAGTIQNVEASGDLRVYFPTLNQTFWLNPTADLIRPIISERFAAHST